MQIVNFQAEKTKFPAQLPSDTRTGEITLLILTPPPAFHASRGHAPRRAWRC